MSKIGARLTSALFAGVVAKNSGIVYVDHAGATLHADSQLKAALQDFSSNLYGNPRILFCTCVTPVLLVESFFFQSL